MNCAICGSDEDLVMFDGDVPICEECLERTGE